MVYVITGGPGFGKTSLLNILERRGFLVGSEKAREFINSKNLGTHTATKSGVPPDFEKRIAQERINFLLSVPDGAIAFADRGLPDQIAYSRYKNKTPSEYIEHVVHEYRYAPYVFITPPWKEIYVRDEIRRESYGEACEIHGHIIQAYQKYDYKLIDLPFESPEKRIEFILNFLCI